MIDLTETAKEFREAFNCSDEFTEKNVCRQRTLIAEELAELLSAEGWLLSSPSPEAKESFLKECADLIYVVCQYAVFLGLDINEAYKRVHANNMSKVGPDGKAVFREDGKLLKPEGYQPVDLSDLV